MKRRIALTLLIVTSIWPIVHAGLVRAFDASPWKGGGWAMYCVSKVRVQTFVFAEPGGRQITGEDLPPARSVELKSVADQFNDLRGELGTLIRPDTLAHCVFRMYPSLQSVRVVVKIFRLDRASAMVVQDPPTELTYHRGEVMQ